MVRHVVTDSSTTKMFHRLPHELFQIVVQYLGVEKAIDEAKDRAWFLFDSLHQFRVYAAYASCNVSDDARLKAGAILRSIKLCFKRWYVIMEIKTRGRDGMLLRRIRVGLM